MSTTSLSLFDLVPGNVILDRYEILRPHRQGGMSAAFEVQDQKAGEQRELHVFHNGLFEGHDQAAEFADRMQAWTELHSPAISRVHGVEVLGDGTVLYVTEFPNGQSLRGWVAENPRMDIDNCTKLGKRLLQGLVAAHAAGLVHGDIKPAAIFCNTKGANSVLFDGGITPALWSAKHLGTRTALIGTPYYAPLEQFTGDSPDELSDLYNVGTVMYELLTGVMPWRGDSYVEVFQSKMQKTPPRMMTLAPGVDVPPELETAVAQSLVAERKERHASARAFLEALDAVPSA